MGLAGKVEDKQCFDINRYGFGEMAVLVPEGLGQVGGPLSVSVFSASNLTVDFLELTLTLTLTFADFGFDLTFASRSFCSRACFVQIPSESEGIPDSVCDVPLCNNPTPLEAFKEYSKIVIDLNNDSTSSDDDSPYGEDIDYVDASPPDAEIVSLEVVEIVIPEVRGVDTDTLLTIKG
ncbi:hypothetical protein Tco_0842092 [Tanacetum coccineum]|uniref:Uncharacterized protein n=1 Tax=Tanacetum coccineum TaxID=301880 RepID=A0ABQ5AYV0_9ASTR